MSAQDNVIKNRRIGRFFVSLMVINYDPAVVRLAMSKVIVLRANVRIEDDTIEYLGICDDFLEVPAGSVYPTYSPVFERLNDGEATPVLREWHQGTDWSAYVGRNKTVISSAPTGAR